MKLITQIQMRWSEGWLPSYVLADYCNEAVSIRLLKKLYFLHLVRFNIYGRFYFRVRRVGSKHWAHFSVEHLF